MKPKQLIGIAVVCCALFLAGCSTAGKNGLASLPVTEQSPQQVHGDIIVWSWNIAAKSLQDISPAFEKRDPGAKVNVDMTGANMQTRFMLSLAAGVGAPDVSQLQLTDAPHYIATHRLADLTPVAAKYQSKFPPSRWADCTLNGHVYAIPWDLGPCAVYYKRDLFAKYGIDPNKIDTWDDYIAAGKAILQKSGGKTKMLPLGANSMSEIFELLLQETQGQIFDDQGRVAINSPQAQVALDVIRKMRQAGICSDVPPYQQEWMAGFTNESIASYPGAVWLGGIIKDAEKDYPGKKPDWGVFRLPAVAHGGLHVANLGGSVLVIPASSPNKDAAWAFVEYALCTNEGQLAQYEKESLYPSFLPALNDPVMDKPDPFFGGQPVGRFFARDVNKIWRLNRTPDWAEAIGYVQQDVSQWVASGMPNNDLLATMAQKLHERLDVPIAAPALAKAETEPPQGGKG
ncbi:MAG TPA: sugar ABC transporter substrate-binding protein [Capsulimonadaceae bacterium]|nr:sugar ABC transporter substrate-binding protein [Capsulimonadaceae bacterium]